VRARLNLILLVLAAACGASLWWAGRAPEPAAAPAAARTAATAPAATVSATPWDEDEPPVRLAVLNGTAIAGLAGDLANSCNRLGCVTTEVGNAPHSRFVESVLVNRRLEDGRARRLAERLGGLPVVREFDDRSGEDAVLVLGADADRIRRAAAAAGGLEAVTAEPAK
jgi:hypothetical protein